MDIKSVSAGATAQQGINKGFDQLAHHSHNIASSIVEHKAEENGVEIDYEALNKLAPDSLEDSIVNMQRTKVQIQSLAKLLEVENQLFEDSLGRIFDTKA